MTYEGMTHCSKYSTCSSERSRGQVREKEYKKREGALGKGNSGGV
jgi:hypothetical protein